MYMVVMVTDIGCGAKLDKSICVIGYFCLPIQNMLLNADGAYQ